MDDGKRWARKVRDGDREWMVETFFTKLDLIQKPVRGGRSLFGTFSPPHLADLPLCCRITFVNYQWLRQVH